MFDNRFLFINTNHLTAINFKNKPKKYLLFVGRVDPKMERQKHYAKETRIYFPSSIFTSIIANYFVLFYLFFLYKPLLLFTLIYAWKIRIKEKCLSVSSAFHHLYKCGAWTEHRRHRISQKEYITRSIQNKKNSHIALKGIKKKILN